MQDKEENKVTFKFEYTDENNVNTKLERKCDFFPEVMDEFDLMMGAYMNFLLACGFSSDLVNNISW